MIGSRLREGRALLRRRGAAFLLALAVEALVALLLLFLAPALPGKKQLSKTVVFSAAAARGDTERAEASKAKAAPRSAERPARQPEPRRPEVPPPPPVPVPDQPPPGPPTFLRLTRGDYQASDVARAASRPAEEPASVAAGPGAGRRGDSAMAEGAGPHGERLYVAEWQVRPTHAQLAAYVSDRAFASGWGLIACRTVPNFRVEDCQELGESPRGSGYAGSVRQAAWQFRVKPPRIGGRYMVGEWVAIRIDYERYRQ